MVDVEAVCHFSVWALTKTINPRNAWVGIAEDAVYFPNGRCTIWGIYCSFVFSSCFSMISGILKQSPKTTNSPAAQGCTGAGTGGSSGRHALKAELGTWWLPRHTSSYDIDGVHTDID